MAVLNKTSLAKTLDAINEAFFLGQSPSKADRQSASAWLASRQGQPGSYWGMFAPTTADFNSMKLFTGEALSSRASIAHILGQETCRAMILLNDPRKTVQESLSAARDAMAERCLSGDPRTGYVLLRQMFCGNVASPAGIRPARYGTQIGSRFEFTENIPGRNWPMANLSFLLHAAGVERNRPSPSCARNPLRRTRLRKTPQA